MLDLSFLDELDYSILHGWQNLPEKILSDLDIAIAPADLSRLAERLLEDKSGHLVNLLQHESTCFYFVLAMQEGEKARFLPVDAATDYRRDGRVWFSAKELLEGRRRWKEFWISAPEVEFKYLLVKKILKQSVTAQAAERLQELARELGFAAERISRELLGDRWGPRVLAWIQNGDRKSLEANLLKLKKVLKWEKFKKDPLNPLRYWLPETGRIWRRWRYPTGLWVAVLGPDGAGKSTLIRGLERELMGAFRRAATLHLMPRLLRPRREGKPVTDPHGKPSRGRLASLFKLAYYGLEYALGFWLKIRPALVRSTLILFDRYYDDLLVDPKRYRYGAPLAPARWLRRFIPRPDVFLVLDVPVENLLKRKQEVPAEELQRQVMAYRRFALSTPNAFLVDGVLPPREVVHQARDLLLDILHDRYLGRHHIWFGDDSSQHPSLSACRWLSSALGAEVLPARPPTHAYLHLPDGRGYLLPLTSVEVFRKSLALWPAQVRKACALKGVLSAFSRLGIMAPGLRRVRLEEGKGSVFQTLREIFDRKDLVFAVSLGTPGPHRKPVVQVMTSEGEVLGYAKVGWNEETKRLITNEANMIIKINNLKLSHLKVPEIIHFSNRNAKSLLVTSPIEDIGMIGNSDAFVQNVVKILALLVHETRINFLFRESPFWKNLTSRVARIFDYVPTYQKVVLSKAMQAISERLGGLTVPFTLKLGDVTKWNIAVDERNNHLKVIDLEYAQEHWLVGWDVFHFTRSSGLSYLNTAHVVHVVDIECRYINLLYLSYLIDLFTYWYESWVKIQKRPHIIAQLEFRSLVKDIYRALIQPGNGNG